MDRRLFLQALSAATLSQLLGACQQNNRTILEVSSLQKTLPPQLVGKFRSQSQIPVQIDVKSTTQELFSQLQEWQREQQTKNSTHSGQDTPTTTPMEMPPPRLIGLGDYWLPQAIQQNLIQPLPVSNLTRWSALAPRWQQLVRRDRTGQPSQKGDIWGAPYRWGATLMAYRTDKFQDLGWQPSNWDDLWRPELKGYISLLDQPREIIGLTLKKLQKSYNLEDLETVSELPDELKALNDQVLLYASTQYLEPLILGDAWVAVGWSSDILPVVAREPNLQAIVPKSGTALWADLWVQSQTTSSSGADAVSKWIDFWWEETIATNLSQFTSASSPFISDEITEKSQSLLLVSHPDRFDRSEFLLPLPSPTIKQYERLWQTVRTLT